MTVLGIARLERRPGWARVTLDNGSSLELPELAVLQLGLRAGQFLDSAALTALQGEAARATAFDRALRFLGSRPRSAAEVRTRLRRSHYDDDLIEATLERLQQSGYLDDAAFARYWVDQRQRFSPRARRAVSWELRARGVDANTASEALGEIDDVEAAIEAGRPRWTRLRGLPPEQRRDRVARLLVQRGFGWETVKQALRALGTTADAE